MIVTIKIKDVTLTESVANDLKELLDEFVEIDAVESFAIRDLSMGIAVKDKNK